jgi:hypothetical protein
MGGGLYDQLLSMRIFTLMMNVRYSYELRKF